MLPHGVGETARSAWIASAPDFVGTGARVVGIDDSEVVVATTTMGARAHRSACRSKSAPLASASSVLVSRSTWPEPAARVNNESIPTGITTLPISVFTSKPI